MSMIGHNKGPTLEHGTAWRRHCWGRARADLLPTLPIEIVRQRVRRAREIGLEYRTYATVRAITGRDVVALLFSSNALRMHRATDELSKARAARLAAVKRCGTMLAAHPPLDPGELLARLGAHGIRFDHAMPAPQFTDSWGAVRDHFQAAFGDGGVHPAAVLLVGETGVERSWAEAGRMAGYISAGTYFAQAGNPALSIPGAPR